ncbi:MAG TPA: hypothetical protein VEC99_13430, partial [Clostridia bacterium]|nr:hypothetical protein [Clostridia bacterium]
GKIVAALDEHNIQVTARNISNWKTRGGYKAWCQEQDRALETRLLQDNLTEHLRKTEASHLPEVGLQLAATNLSRFFLHPGTQQQLANEPEKFARPISVLCRLARQIHALQKYRDDSAKAAGQNPHLTQSQTEEEMEITRNVYSAAKLGKSAHEPDIPHRNYIPRNPYSTP